MKLFAFDDNFSFFKSLSNDTEFISVPSEFNSYCQDTSTLGIVMFASFYHISTRSHTNNLISRDFDLWLTPSLGISSWFPNIFLCPSFCESECSLSDMQKSIECSSSVLIVKAYFEIIIDFTFSSSLIEMFRLLSELTIFSGCTSDLLVAIFGFRITSGFFIA